LIEHLVLLDFKHEHKFTSSGFRVVMKCMTGILTARLANDIHVTRITHVTGSQKAQVHIKS